MKKLLTPKRLWITLIVLMILILSMIFLYPLAFDYSMAAEYGYRYTLLVDFWRNYPLDVITYLLPFIGIIYLTLIIPKDRMIKKIRYIVAIWAIIILCGIIARWIHTKYVEKDWVYEYFKITNPERLDTGSWDSITTGYNLMDFIMGK